MSSRTLIAMPAYNEGKVIQGTLREIKKEAQKHMNWDILVVNDSSKDNTSTQAQKEDVLVVDLPVNRGAGGATATIIKYAKNHQYDQVVLIDADGQHNPKEIKKLLHELEKGKHDVIIGSRTIENNKNMPTKKKIANFVGSGLTYIFFGRFVWDSQSGFKAMNKKAIDNVTITFDRYEFCSEVIGECHRHKLNVKEVPIDTIYTDHSMSKGHGQNIFNGFVMLFRFMIKPKKK